MTFITLCLNKVNPFPPVQSEIATAVMLCFALLRRLNVAVRVASHRLTHINLRDNSTHLKIQEISNWAFGTHFVQCLKGKCVQR